MIFDIQNIFSNKQVVTASAASTEVLDLGAMGIPYGSIEAPNRDKGLGKNVPILVQVTEDFAALTDLTITVETSDDENFGSGVIIHASTQAVALSALKAGRQFSIDSIPNANDDGGHRRYMRLNYTVNGANATAGKIFAGITMGIQTNA